MRSTESTNMASLLSPVSPSTTLIAVPVARVRTITHTVTELLHKSIRSEQANYSSPLPSVSDYRKIRPLGVPAAGFVDDVGELLARVQRRHRRLEQKEFPIAGDQERALRMARHPSVIEKNPLPLANAKNEFPAETTPRSRAARPQPTMDIGQITDAVLQQLDRRLVAARERMGRI